MKNLSLLTFVVAAGVLSCEFHARSPEDYRQAVRTVIETRNVQIQGCYDDVLKQDSNAAGTVVVHFSVTEDTGSIMKPELTPESTAPQALGQCVVNALAGLTLAPPDAREGDATFVWEFQKKS